MKRRVARLLFCAVFVMSSFPLMAAPPVGVYRWDAPSGPGNVDAFSRWLGKSAMHAVAFEARDNWASIDGADWQLGPWSQWVRAQYGRNLILSVPMLPGATDLAGPDGRVGTSDDLSLAKCAWGYYDTHWKNLANNLAYYGLHWAYLRLGWEMDGGWFAWRAQPGSGREANFAGCFRRIVQVMRAAQPANQWKFVWNPNAGAWDKTYLDKVWPGDAYVDVVAIDLYDQSWALNTYPYPSTCDSTCRLTRQQNAWNNYSKPLLLLRDYARAHGKAFALPEWGLSLRSDGRGGGDNPYYIRKMHEFITSSYNNVAFQSYFDVTLGAEHHKISPADGTTTKFPQAAELFRQLFGSTTAGPTDVTFSAPAQNATISGSFSDSTGCQVIGTGISRVVFSIDTTQLNTEGAAPWQCKLDTRNFANGTHTLRAVAYNSAGTSTTVTRTVNVQNGPSVSFKAPAANATISGSFGDSSGCEVAGTGISRVVFYMDSKQLNTEYAAPWQCRLDTRIFANGTHTISAVAYNAAGASTTVSRTVKVQN